MGRWISGHGARTLLIALFLASGCTGVVFEVVASKLLGLVMGNSMHAITAAVTAFMGGLALGSALAGKISRGWRPLALYGSLEAGVALACLAFPTLLEGLQPVLKSLHGVFPEGTTGFVAIRFFLAFVLLMVPTTLMGATLPVLVDGLMRTGSSFRSTVGTLYSVNSFGAVVGALAASFLLLPNLGIQATLQFIALTNLTIAFLATRADRWLEAQLTAGTESSGHVPVDRPAAAVPGTEAPVPRWLPLALGAGGFAAMIYQIAWTRALVLVLGSSTYAFSMILAGFISGISAGGLIARKLETFKASPGLLLAGLTAGVSIAGMLTLPVLSQMPMLLIEVLIDFSTQWWMLQVAEILLVALVVFVPAAMMGACFPVAARMLDRVDVDVARDLGRLYAANTFGNIFGSLAAGVAFVPMLGIQGTILLASVIEGAIAGLLTVACLPGNRGPRLAWASAAVTGPLILFLVIPTWDAQVMTSGPYLYAGLYIRNARRSMGDYKTAMKLNGRIIFHREGSSATVTVREDSAGTRGLVVNGKTDASSFHDMKTQRLVGHLPMAMHQKPDDVLVIGLGAGVTLASVLTHPAKRVDLVEICPEIVEASRLFARENRLCTDDKRVKLTVGDGRNFLALTDRRYDVIVAEPTNPWIAGVASLFTREFFSMVRSHLTPGGVAAQWVQAYSMDPEDFRGIIRTYRSVFPSVTLWRSTRGTDYVLIGSEAPLMPKPEQLAARLATPLIRDELSEVGIDDALDLYGHFLCTPKTLDPFVAGAPLMTDDNLRLEFTAPRSLFNRWGEATADAEKTQEDVTQYVSTPTGQSTLDFRKLVTSRSHVSKAMSFMKDGNLDGAIAEMRMAKELAPADRGSAKLFQAVYLGMTSLLDRVGRSDEAASWLKQVAALNPTDPDLYNELGSLTGTSGDAPAAEQYFTKAVSLDKNHVAAHKNLGYLYYTQGRYADAIKAYERVVQLSPYESRMLNNLGILYEKVERKKEARTAWEQALKVDPSFEAPRRNLEEMLGTI